MKLTAFASLIVAINSLKLREEDDEPEEECNFLRDFHDCCYVRYPIEACDAVWACMNGDDTEETMNQCVKDLGFEDEGSEDSEGYEGNYGGERSESSFED